MAAKLAEKIGDLPLAIVGGAPESRKAVVGMDRSLLARKGIVHLVRLMSRTLEDIRLCHVVRPLYQPGQDRESFFDGSHEARWLDSGSRKINPTMLYVKQLLTQAGMAPERLRTVILKEKTSRADGICAEAEQAGAGTIIVGRRGATVVDEFTMGRVTRKILYMAFDKAVWIV